MSTVSVAFDTAGIVSVIVGTVIPLLTALVAKEHWARDLKGVITLVLSAVSGLLSQFLESLQTNNDFHWKAAVLSAAATFLWALATYFGIWKNGVVQTKLINSGNTDYVNR